MRPYTGPPQQQQSHQPQQYCGIDNNNLKQQQHFSKSHQNLQQQSGLHISQQQNYHQHQLQQHVLHQQQPLPPTPHMWNPHFGSACFTSQTATANPNPVNTPINPQSCRPFPNNRLYQHPTHASHYPPSNGFPHAIPAKTQGSERMPLTAPNYAKLPPLSVVNQQRINECAGIPLISTATAHLTPGQRQRISRKQSHSPPAKSWSNMLTTNAVQNYTAVTHYAAAHVQGAPLMLNKQQQQQMPEYWSPNAYACSNHQQHQQQFTSNSLQYNGKQQDRTRTALRYQNSAPAALVSSKSKENLVQQLKHSKDNDNPSSNIGDSSNSNEACLPRIIKPRKRRKKDRKPPSSLVNAVYLKMDNRALHDKSSNTHINTMKSNKCTDDLLKCLEKFTKITNFNEQTQRSNRTACGHMIENSTHKEPKQNISHCTADSTNSHGICFCNGCDPLRSLWDYPLKRSLSDSSTSVTSGTGSLSDNNASSTVDYNWPKTRAEIVGVIGSKRNKDLLNPVYKRNSDFSKTEIKPENTFFNNNILSGINFASELFKQTNYTAYNNLEQTLSAPENMLLLPETAETLLTKSINEISKKLIETCSNETTDLTLPSCNSFSSSFSTASSNSSSANSSCADFSNDSGIESAHINAGDDLVFNFDNLHITTTKLSLSPSSLSSSASLASSSSSSSSTSSCGNLSMSSSPTVKFTSNFLTTPATAASTMHQTTKTTPLTPDNNVMGTTMKAAPTLDFLLDLNNNHLHVAVPNAMINTENQQQQLQNQRFNDLVQNHQPPEQQQQEEKLQSAALPPTHQHDQQQFFNNCFDLMWQHNERQLGNNNKSNANTNTNTASTSTTINNNNTNNNIYICNNTNSNRIEQLTSSTLTSNNVAMSSFLDSLGSLKAVFSTLS